MIYQIPNVMTELAPKGPRFVEIIEIMDWFSKSLISRKTMQFLENWSIPSDTKCYDWVSTEGTQICGNYRDNGLTGHPLFSLRSPSSLNVSESLLGAAHHFFLFSSSIFKGGWVICTNVIQCLSSGLAKNKKNYVHVCPVFPFFKVGLLFENGGTNLTPKVSKNILSQDTTIT